MRLGGTEVGSESSSSDRHRERDGGGGGASQGKDKPSSACAKSGTDLRPDLAKGQKSSLVI